MGRRRSQTTDSSTKKSGLFKYKTKTDGFHLLLTDIAITNLQIQIKMIKNKISKLY